MSVFFEYVQLNVDFLAYIYSEEKFFKDSLIWLFDFMIGRTAMERKENKGHFS